MESLHENEIYQIKKGRTLDDDDGPVKDVITTGLESLSEGMKNPIFEYNGAFTRLQTRRKMKPVIPGSLGAAMNTKISMTHSNAGPTVCAQTPVETAQGLEFISHVPSSATELDGAGICDEASNEDENVVGYLDNIESGLRDSETMVKVSTAADVDLDMDEVEIEDEVMDEDSDEEDE